MLYNLKIIIDNSDFKSKRHIMSSFYSTNVLSTNPNTSKITKNAIQNFIKLKFKIVIHENNLLNQLHNLINV